MGNVESVGTAQVIYTVEPNAEDESKVIVTFWLSDGLKIGSMSIPRENIKR